MVCDNNIEGHQRGECGGHTQNRHPDHLITEMGEK